MLSAHPVVRGSHIKPTSFFSTSIISTFLPIFPEKQTCTAEVINELTVFSLNFSSVGNGPFLISKARNMCQRRILLSGGGGGGASRSWRLYFPASCQQPTDRKVFSTPQNKEFLRMKPAFAARVNLVTQVAEVANFSFWYRKSKSRIGTEAPEKIVSLHYSER